MDTAGKAVLFCGVTVLISLTAVMLVPSPAFRSMALGIMLSVVFVLAATLTLLPAVLAKLGPRVDALSLPWVHSGEHRSARFARWGERLWRRPALYGVPAALVLVALAVPVLGLDTGMPSIKVVPEDDSSRAGLRTRSQDAFGTGAPGALQVRRRRRGRRRASSARRGGDSGIAQVAARCRSRAGVALVQAIPARTPPTPRSARRSTGCGPSFPPARSSAAPWPRTTTSRRRSPTRPRS